MALPSGAAPSIRSRRIVRLALPGAAPAQDEEDRRRRGQADPEREQERPHIGPLVDPEGGPRELEADDRAGCEEPHCPRQGVLGRCLLHRPRAGRHRGAHPPELPLGRGELLLRLRQCGLVALRRLELATRVLQRVFEVSHTAAQGVAVVAVRGHASRVPQPSRGGGAGMHTSAGYRPAQIGRYYLASACSQCTPSSPRPLPGRPPKLQGVRKRYFDYFVPEKLSGDASSLDLRRRARLFVAVCHVAGALVVVSALTRVALGRPPPAPWWLLIGPTFAALMHAPLRLRKTHSLDRAAMGPVSVAFVLPLLAVDGGGLDAPVMGSEEEREEPRRGGGRRRSAEHGRAAAHTARTARAGVMDYRHRIG